MISEMVKFFKQLRHAMQGRTMQNKRAKYSNDRYSASLKIHKFVVECLSVRHIFGYSKCSKWRPLIFTQQSRRLRHWSTASSLILCYKPLGNQASLQI